MTATRRNIPAIYDTASKQWFVAVDHDFQPKVGESHGPLVPYADIPDRDAARLATLAIPYVQNGWPKGHFQ